MFNDVKALLEELGVTITENDTWLINFCFEKVENNIKNNCNVETIPDGLHEQAVSLVCAEFLTVGLNTGRLNYDKAIKKIKEGDTDVEFVEGSSDIELMNKLIGSLNKQVNFATYRKFKW